MMTNVLELPPPAAMARVVGEMANVHEELLLWVTVTSCPATVSVPMRCEVDVLAVALNVTVPLPLPLAPLAMVSHEALLVAFHVHPPATVTAVVDDPAAEVSVREVGDTLKLHATPLWVTVRVWPATVSVPTRCVVAVFAATLKVTVAPTVPLAPLVIVNQGALLVAAQLQLLPLVTMTSVLELPPAAPMVRAVGERPNVQEEEETPVWMTVTG
jgi:hypothetical protein